MELNRTVVLKNLEKKIVGERSTVLSKELLRNQEETSRLRDPVFIQKEAQKELLKKEHDIKHARKGVFVWSVAAAAMPIAFAALGWTITTAAAIKISFSGILIIAAVGGSIPTAMCAAFAGICYLAKKANEAELKKLERL
jgi:hypothetical protein